MSDIDARAPGILARRRVGCDRLGAVTHLSAEERRQREDAVRFANASMRLGGFQVSDEENARSDRFIAGEIDLAEFLRRE